MILVIDNYDSFTWNLVQYLRELGAKVEVVRNDATTVAEIRSRAPAGIVISPGPCTPLEAGISVDVVRDLGPTIPLLGVCLGHQAIGQAFGGTVVRNRRIMHGKVSPVAHRGDGLFAGIPSPFRVTRYHSLVVDRDTLPAELEVTAWTDEEGWEDEIQALRHRSFPIVGVQFHPESIATEHGHKILDHFLEMTR